jgi:hypothetical protein
MQERKKKRRRKQKMRKKERRKGSDRKMCWIDLFCLCGASCSWLVTTFVPRLTSLAWFSLGPAQYHCWTIIQLAFISNVVLVHSLFQPTYSSTYSITAWQVLLLRHRYTSFQACKLVGCRPLLLSKVRTCKSLFEQVQFERITPSPS